MQTVLKTEYARRFLKKYYDVELFGETEDERRKLDEAVASIYANNYKRDVVEYRIGNSSKDDSLLAAISARHHDIIWEICDKTADKYGKWITDFTIRPVSPNELAINIEVDGDPIDVDFLFIDSFEDGLKAMIKERVKEKERAGSLNDPARFVGIGSKKIENTDIKDIEFDMPFKSMLWIFKELGCDNDELFNRVSQEKKEKKSYPRRDLVAEIMVKMLNENMKQEQKDQGFQFVFGKSLLNRKALFGVVLENDPKRLLSVNPRTLKAAFDVNMETENPEIIKSDLKDNEIEKLKNDAKKIGDKEDKSIEIGS